ncbi:hypothetical protein AQPE_2148 [Aquipluma nitroreducens]|uniref:Uncharacterized protein n=1 Tax=Aquipluma nitroreducens TaxID=2010828 RepID=A0A5K7S939_9BACT|nr:hypothetical protein [Aquipluma nitroreducens]BBE17989.1 hypothetical protein AQPE_2148 [Aquipluma nitroreducens]
MGTSKMDSSAVYTLFEELKQKIDELSKKSIPDNQANSTFDTEELISLIEDLQIRINQQQFTPEQIKNLGQISAYSVNKVSENLNKGFTEIKAVITPIDEKVSLLRFPQNIAIRNDHFFSVDFRNSKAAITMISMALIILLSFGGNIWQLNRNSQLKDNDLKYRYIKSTNGIDPENLYKLEDIFQYNRDKKLIKEIRGNVEEYERNVKEVAEKIERERLKNDNTK